MRNVLVPVVFVSGMAWFSISLASMREELASFGLELTRNIFESFLSSMFILVSILLLTLNPWVVDGLIDFVDFLFPEGRSVVDILAGVAATGGVLKIFYSLCVGSVKYDANDSMLSGQNEKAEVFFRRSLSDLRKAADELRSGVSLELANYHLSWALEYFCIDLMKMVKARGGREPVEFQKIILDLERMRASPSGDHGKSDEFFVDVIGRIIECVRVPLSVGAVCGMGTKEFCEIVNHIEKGLYNIENCRKNMTMLADARFARVLDLLSDLSESNHDLLVSNLMSAFDDDVDRREGGGKYDRLFERIREI